MNIVGPAGQIAATLAAGGFVQDAALILPGSGPTDRNGNNTAGLNTDAYRLLAEALWPEGVATLRYDKRGLGGSAGDANDVSLADYRDDIAALTQTLQDETGVECVWLIGHSEGGILALAAADLPDICGLILIATPGRPLGPIILEQLARQPGTAFYLPAVELALTQLAVGEAPDISALPPGLAALFHPATQDYLRELAQTDPAALLAETNLPVGILCGTEDIQVAEADADALGAARDGLIVRRIEGMTHTLKQAEPGNLAANLTTYSDPTLSLHPGLIPAIMDIIGQHR